MSVCLLATASNRQKVEMSALVCIFFLPFPFHILYKLRDARPILFASLFLYSSSGHAKQQYRENGDHHIIFDVTIDICKRVPSIFFAVKPVLSVLIHHYSSFIYFFYIWHAREGKKEPVLSFCVHSWLAIANTRSSHHVLFGQLFIYSIFFIEGTTESLVID